MTVPRIIVLGASGLIGHFVASDLVRRGYQTVAVARRFTAAQRDPLGDAAREIPLANLDAAALSRLLEDTDLVVNCLGVLQDNPTDSTQAVHEAFVAKLVCALGALSRPVLLVHVSIPGRDADDRTAFAVSKRNAERAIVASGLPHAILKPGFVFAPAAYGGSAMLRALAVLPFDVPRKLAARPFAIVDVHDVARTVAVLADRWAQAATQISVQWDLVHPDPLSLGEALARLRRWLGAAPRWRMTLPAGLLTIGTWAGDLASWLGWRPSIRSTVLAELQRGVSGDPHAWMAETGIAPASFDDSLKTQPATIQEKWFARLYLLKAAIIPGLVIFWCASALIALTVAYRPAVAILTTHGYPDGPAQYMTIAGSVVDFCVGLAIAFRRTHRFGLLAGTAVSFFYMIAAAILTPDLWVEPLGALVKTFPAIILMLVALAIADDR
jgi:uncharacterized protein YbjT (DUF2867 family)